MSAVSWKPDWHTARRWPCASLSLAAAAVLVAYLPAAAAWLQYDRAAIATGEVWRFLTGHWTHLSGDHLFWDVVMFVVLGIPCERQSRRRYAVCLTGAAVLIPVLLWCLLPGLTTYRGLSGIDAALFALLAVGKMRHELEKRCWGRLTALAVVCLAFAGKVTYELLTSDTLFVDSQAAHMVPVPLAHGIGAAVGVAAGLAKVPGSIADRGYTLRRISGTLVCSWTGTDCGRRAR